MIVWFFYVVFKVYFSSFPHTVGYIYVGKFIKYIKICGNCNLGRISGGYRTSHK